MQKLTMLGILLSTQGLLLGQAPVPELIIPPAPPKPIPTANFPDLKIPQKLPSDLKSTGDELIIPASSEMPGTPVLNLPPAPEVPMVLRAPNISGATTGTVGQKGAMPARTNATTTKSAPMYPQGAIQPSGKVEIREASNPPKMQQQPLQMPAELKAPTGNAITLPNRLTVGNEMPAEMPKGEQGIVLIEPLPGTEVSTKKGTKSKVVPTKAESKTSVNSKTTPKITKTSATKTQDNATPVIQEVVPANTPVKDLPPWAQESVTTTETPINTVGEWWSPNGLPRLELNAGYLLWWMKGQSSPPIVGFVPVTTANATRLAPSMIQTRFPQEDMSYDVSGGVKGSALLWVDKKQLYGVEVAYFYTEQQNKSNLFGSNGSDITGLSFINTSTGLRDLIPLSIPGTIDATTRINQQIEFQGGEINLVNRGFPIYQRNVQLLMGFRYLNLRESLEIQNAWVMNDSSSFMRANDYFGTRNEFFGGQLGAKFHFETGKWAVDVTTKLAIGELEREVRIRGNTVFDGPTTAVVRPEGGVYALATNAGTYRSTNTSLVPEFQATLGYKFTKNITGLIGYNFMAITNVVRPGDQIDPNINPDLIPVVGTISTSQVARPGFLGVTDTFWAQGIQLGLNISY